MRFKFYRLQLIFRLLLLAFTIYLLAATGFTADYRATVLGLLAAVGLQIWLLIRFHENSIKQLNRFLNAVSYDDFTEQFQPEGAGSFQQELARRLNEVMGKFREVRTEKEAQLHYFETIVQHVGIGIITYKPSGEVLLMNTAAKKILQVNQLKKIAELGSFSSELPSVLQQPETAEKALVQFRQNGTLGQLSVHVIELVLLREPIRIASLQNIQPELEEKEMEAWHNLVKVLTHEIMNSVTPIASLSASAHEEVASFTDTEAEEVTVLKDELLDIGHCLQTISRRSDGLIKFLNDFRSLTTNRTPQLSLFNSVELLQELKTLFREQLAAQQTDLQLEVQSESLMLSADRSLLEQVLINLVKNALEAVKDAPEKRLVLRAFLNEKSRLVIEVSDTGTGLTPEAQAKIFIPFYTTKATGSGIGLSWSRQIMRLHKGTITVQSELGTGTTFTLRF